MRRVEYSPRVDAVIYSPEALSFTQQEWLETALACLDQADITYAQIEEIRQQLETITELTLPQ